MLDLLVLFFLLSLSVSDVFQVNEYEDYFQVCHPWRIKRSKIFLFDISHVQTVRLYDKKLSIIFIHGSKPTFYPVNFTSLVLLRRRAYFKRRKIHYFTQYDDY